LPAGRGGHRLVPEGSPIFGRVIALFLPLGSHLGFARVTKLVGMLFKAGLHVFLCGRILAELLPVIPTFTFGHDSRWDQQDDCKCHQTFHLHVPFSFALTRLSPLQKHCG
jgi:hypothetical protein